jgi:uncharacterized C2H2 Zn-finger protein
MFTCEVCNAQFTRKVNLTKHQRKGHNFVFKCPHCDKTFTCEKDLIVHKKSHTFTCFTCRKKFSTIYTLRRHEKSCLSKYEKSCTSEQSSFEDRFFAKPTRPEDIENCAECGANYSRHHLSSHLRSNIHIEKCKVKFDEHCFVYKSALKGRLVIYRIPNESRNVIQDLDLNNFMQEMRDCMQKILKYELALKTTLKFRLTIQGLYKRPLENGEDVEKCHKFFSSEYILLSHGDDIDMLCNKAARQAITRADEYAGESSGWTILQVLVLDIEIGKVNMLESGSSYIPLPENIISKRACVNVKNEDNKCFLYAVLSGYFYNEMKPFERTNPSAYEKYKDFFNTDNIQYPLTLREIRIFERDNIHKKVSINVFVLQGEQIEGPLYLTKNEQSNHLNLLLVENKRESHYVFISNLSRLVSNQINKSGKIKYFCNSCLTRFYKEKDLEFHRQLGCGQVKINIPREKPFIEFQNYSAMVFHSFVIYGDVESVLEKVSSSRPSSEKAYSYNLQKHRAASYAYSIKSEVKNDQLEKLRLYRGEDCLEHFVDSLEHDVKTIYHTYLKIVKPMNYLDYQTRQRLNSQTFCYFCKEEFKLGDKICVDHNHVSGAPRNRSHSACNLKCVTPKFIPFYLHGMSHYDMHLLIMGLSKRKTFKFKCIPITKENYISVSVMIPVDKQISFEIRFLDSFRYLPSSLATLTETLKSCPKYEKFHKEKFPDTNFWVDPKKQFLCYSYLDSFEKFNETEFPPQEAFYNDLTCTNIADEDYNHGKSVFDYLKKVSPSTTLGDYVDYYLTCDVYLLEDIMESFRKTSMEFFGLDASFYYTCAGLSFDAMLAHIKQPIHLMTDENQILLVSKSIRGGISSAMHRYSVANNKYLKSGYDSSKGPPVYNWYIDCVALYSHIMKTFKLAISGYEFMEEFELVEFKKNFMDLPINGDFGYLVLCDVDYPEHLHNLHNDLPFLVESMKVGKTQKLVPNLHHKKNYCAHFSVIQQAVKFGLVLKDIHKVLKFRQSFWLKSYIEFLSDKRRDATTEFDKLLLKLFCNSVFGKTIEKTDKHRDVKLLNKWKNERKKLDVMRYLKSPRFKSFNIFNEDFIAIEMQKTTVKWNRPILTGNSKKLSEILKKVLIIFYRHVYIRFEQVPYVSILLWISSAKNITQESYMRLHR